MALVSSLPTLPTDDPRAPVIEALRGQKLEIPDLFAIYPDWKGELHPDYEQVREELEQWLSKWVRDEKQREKQRKVDAACFYPAAPLDKYRI
ncbi:hypothetical protein VTN77DRAFT_8812 [Rasamsonia byssochlamydoides]|uniref:uncharacterized protein n=1 Tax=Rasamsonia byssochlamydoides TaxID=89139 RepID=UPI0037442B8E